MVEQLLQRGHTPHALTRNADNAVHLESMGAVPVIGDLSDFNGLYAVTSEVDSVAFLLPAFLDDSADAFMFGRNAIDAAIKAGVEHFAWNASGEISDEASESNAKLAILEHLKGSGLPFVVFEPTTYMENWLGPWTAPSVRLSN